ncbi:MAG: T9SS type A sorting domain-containing protein [Flavipsychrobacter sp.]|nr:T9SS type A sorting domain-containing protein [Flavipsychrobacter sp.]
MKKILFPLLFLLATGAGAQSSIFATIGGGDLYRIDLATCSRTFVGATGVGFGDIAFTTDGKLWGIAGGELFQIDTTTGVATSVGQTWVGAISLVGLNDTILLAEEQMKLYRINTNTAIAEYVDTIGYQALGDFTWYDNDLYMVSTGSQIVKIELDSAVTAIQSVTAIGSTVPGCEGAVTAEFTDDYNAIVGFSGEDAIKICQIDGSHQVLCPAINPGGTPGAASMRLATQMPEPTLCAVPAQVKSVYAHTRLEVFPNPATHELRVTMDVPGKCDFRIYNAVGQVVLSGTLSDSRLPINISGLPNGFYTLEAHTGKETLRRNFTVSK